MQPHLSKGLSDQYAFVLSCPGKFEERAGHPAAGTTGRNLEELLVLLSSRLGQTTLARDSVTITNAWPEIEYLARTGRSQATDLEIRDATNINRLASELSHVSDLIVFCGDKARIASIELARLSLLPQRTKLTYIEHLGARGLLSIVRDLQGNRIVAAKEQRRRGNLTPVKKLQAANTRRRVEVVVQGLLDGIRPLG